MPYDSGNLPDHRSRLHLRKTRSSTCALVNFARSKLRAKLLFKLLLSSAVGCSSRYCTTGCEECSTRRVRSCAAPFFLLSFPFWGQHRAKHRNFHRRAPAETRNVTSHGLQPGEWCDKWHNDRSIERNRKINGRAIKTNPARTFNIEQKHLDTMTITVLID